MEPNRTTAEPAGGSAAPGASGIGAAVSDLSKAGETIKHEAASLSEAAKYGLREQAEQLSGTAAESLTAFAEAVKKAGDELKQGDQTFAARLMGEAAGGLQSLSRSLSSASVEDVFHSVRDFGKSNPTAFLAGSVLAGIALGRFARSSGHHAEGAAQRSGTAGNGGQVFSGTERERGTDRDLFGSGASADRGGSPAPAGQRQGGADRGRNGMSGGPGQASPAGSPPSSGARPAGGFGSFDSGRSGTDQGTGRRPSGSGSDAGASGSGTQTGSQDRGSAGTWEKTNG